MNKLWDQCDEMMSIKAVKDGEEMCSGGYDYLPQPSLPSQQPSTSGTNYIGRTSGTYRVGATDDRKIMDDANRNFTESLKAAMMNSSETNDNDVFDLLDVHESQSSLTFV